MLEHAGLRDLRRRPARRRGRAGSPARPSLTPRCSTFACRRLTGIEAARRILAERSIPIVMLTAYADPATVTEAVRAGVFAYVVKPFREQDLLPALETACRPPARVAAQQRDLGRAPERASGASRPRPRRRSLAAQDRAPGRRRYRRPAALGGRGAPVTLRSIRGGVGSCRLKGTTQRLGSSLGRETGTSSWPSAARSCWVSASASTRTRVVRPRRRTRGCVVVTARVVTGTARRCGIAVPPPRSVLPRLGKAQRRDRRRVSSSRVRLGIRRLSGYALRFHSALAIARACKRLQELTDAKSSSANSPYRLC